MHNQVLSDTTLEIQLKLYHQIQLESDNSLVFTLNFKFLQHAGINKGMLALFVTIN